MSKTKRPLRFWRTLLRDTGGLALIELAYGLPILLAMGFSGIEVANLAVARMRISQIALTVADNASRVGESNGLTTKVVYESDVYDTFEAARIQGTAYDLQQRGRIILSSLQQNASGGQWIAWQRCWGQKAWTSTYGTVGTGRTGTSYAGMGPTGSKITAPANGAVMFVEVAYEYQAIVEPFAQGLAYFGLDVDSQMLTYKAAFIVRDPRTLGDSTQASRSSTNDYGLMQNTPALTRLDC